MNRKQSVSLLGLLTAIGCLFIVYFSKDVKALDTIDFWVGTFLIFVLATVLIIVFGWVMGIEKGWREAHRGAVLRIPRIFKFIIKYVSPLYLLVIFVFWILFNVLGWDPSTHKFKPTGYVMDLIGSQTVEASTVARLSVMLIGIVILFLLILIAVAGKRWNTASQDDVRGGADEEESPTGADAKNRTL